MLANHRGACRDTYLTNTVLAHACRACARLHHSIMPCHAISRAGADVIASVSAAAITVTKEVEVPGVPRACPGSSDRYEAHTEADHGDVCRGGGGWHCPIGCAKPNGGGKPYCETLVTGPQGATKLCRRATPVTVTQVVVQVAAPPAPTAPPVRHLCPAIILRLLHSYTFQGPVVNFRPKVWFYLSMVRVGKHFKTR